MDIADSAKLVRRILAEAEPIQPGSGRGIVICADRGYFVGAFCVVSVLRGLDCWLPAEVWHWHPLEEWQRDALASLGGVTVRDLREVLPHRPSYGFGLKPTAVLHSSFAEVLSLDADNVPAANPEFLFSQPLYQESGCLLWPDFVGFAPGSTVPRLFGVGPVEREIESGQIVIDRARHWRALRLLSAINSPPHDFFFHQNCGGDKNTWPLSVLAAGGKYGLIPHRPVMREYWHDQHAPDGTVLFQHTNRRKLRAGGDYSALVSGGMVHDALTALTARGRRGRAAPTEARHPRGAC